MTVIKNVNVTCGKRTTIDAFDENGEPVTYQIIPTPPDATPPNPPPPPPPADVVRTPIIPSPGTGGVAAEVAFDMPEGIDVVHKRVSVAFPDRYLLLDDELLEAMVWPVEMVNDTTARFTFDLPPDLGLRPRAGMVVIFHTPE
jgi:hypothetical protein